MIIGVQTPMAHVTSTNYSHGVVFTGKTNLNLHCKLGFDETGYSNKKASFENDFQRNQYKSILLFKREVKITPLKMFTVIRHVDPNIWCKCGPLFNI